MIELVAKSDGTSIFDHDTTRELVKFALDILLERDLNGIDMSDAWEGCTVNDREFDVNFYSDLEYGSGLTNGINVVAYLMYWDAGQQSRYWAEPLTLFSRWGADMVFDVQGNAEVRGVENA